MQHSTLGERGVHHRPLHVPPIIGVALAYDDDIEGHPERPECSSETHHLGVPVLRIALDDQEVEVAVGAGITAGMRTKEHDLDRIGGDGRQGLAGGLYDLLWNHDNTVAKPSGRFALGWPKAMDTTSTGLSAVGLHDRLRCQPPRLPTYGLHQRLNQPIQGRAGVRTVPPSSSPSDGQLSIIIASGSCSGIQRKTR